MRIVSLLPSATEILGDIGLADQLLAVSHECDTPASILRLPRITSSILDHGLSPAEIDAAVSLAVRESRPLYRVDPGLLAALQPELIVTQGVCDVCAVTPEVVNHALDLVPGALLADVQVLSLDARSVVGVFDDVLAVGRATGASTRAEAVVATHRARWEALQRRATGSPRPKVLLLEWADPLFYGGHWVPEQIAAAGGTDVMGTAGVDSGRTSWEAVAKADPDVVLLACCGYDLERNLAVAAGLPPKAADLRAAREGRVWACDANALFSRPALRLVRGAEVIAHILDDGPDLPGEAVRVTIGAF